VNEAAQKQEQLTRAAEERAQIERAFPVEFADGAKRGFTGNKLYPRSLHHWPQEKRNAWFAGWNVGYCDRKRAEGGDAR
jgi:hypothetical protein